MSDPANCYLESVEIGKNLKITSGFPFSSKYFSSESGFPLIRIRDILNSKIETFYLGSFTDSFIVKSGDILIGMDGDFHVVKWRNSDGLLNQRILKIEVNNPSIISLRFIFYWLIPYIQIINDKTAATTVKHLSIKDIQKATGSIPRIKNQEKIASILETIDQTIAHTEALIQKYQQIKAGLMHDLFTRGIAPNGQLRPPREEAPELYQETAIGWIPREWDWGALSKYLNGSPKNGFSPREIDEWNGCFSLGLGCLTSSGYRPVQLKSVDLRSAIVSGAFLEDGDFLVSRANTPQLVGLCGVYQKMSSPCIYPDLMMRIQPNKLIHAKYLEQYLLSAEVRIRLTALAVGTSASMVKLNSKSLMNFLVAVPEEEEQKKIIKQSNKINNYLNSLEYTCSKLKYKKFGLMHDLLTGKVPVTISES
jgi:type I restriction enzyme, S subunit